jgi:hypothetical protein
VAGLSIVARLNLCNTTRRHRHSSDFVCFIDVRHAAISAFEDIKVGQVPKSRRCSNEPHDLSAAWAKRRPWLMFNGVFIAHDRERSLNDDVMRSGPAGALVHRCGNDEIKNWYRIRPFGDDRHRGALSREETCIPRIYGGLTGSMRKWSRVAGGVRPRGHRANQATHKPSS